MKTLRNILIVVGAIALIMIISVLVIGLKVVSQIFLYIAGTLAVICLIGVAIYYFGKWSGGNKKE